MDKTALLKGLKPDFVIPEDGVVVDGMALSAYLDREHSKEIRTHMGSEVSYISQILYKPLPAAKFKQPLNKERTKRAKRYSKEQIRRLNMELNPGQFSVMDKLLMYIKQDVPADDFISVKQLTDRYKEKYPDDNAVRYNVSLITQNRNFGQYFVYRRDKTALLMSPKAEFISTDISELAREFVLKNTKKNDAKRVDRGKDKDKDASRPAASAKGSTNDSSTGIFNDFMEVLKKYNVKDFHITFKE